MTKHLRIITALLALIFCVSAVSSFSVTVFAESQVSEEPANPDPVITPEPVNPEPVNPDPVTPEPDSVTPEPDPVTPEPEPVNPEPYNDDSGYNSNSNNNNNSNNNYNNYGSGDSDNGSSADNGSESSAVYYDSDGNEHDSQSDVYVGGGQTYVPPVSTAPSAPLIKTQNNIDAEEHRQGRQRSPCSGAGYHNAGAQRRRLHLSDRFRSPQTQANGGSSCRESRCAQLRERSLPRRFGL